MASIKHRTSLPITMSTLTLAPVTVIFTGATMNDVYEQITKYIANNPVKLPNSSTSKAPSIPSIPIHHYVSAPAPAPVPTPPPTLTPKELVIQDLKTAMEAYSKEQGRVLEAVMCKELIEELNSDASYNPYFTLITNTLNNNVYDELFTSIRTHCYDSVEASATQKHKDRKAAILAALNKKKNSYPRDATYQRDAYHRIINDINHLPSNLDTMTYLNLKGVGNSIFRVISDVCDKYK